MSAPKRLKLWPLAVFVCCVLGSQNAAAVIVGDIQINSRLGQTLNGTIDIQATPGEQLYPSCFKLLAREVPIQSEFFGDTRSGKLFVSSSVRVREPLINLRLSVDCPELPRTRREFAIFLDPPNAQRPRLANEGRFNPEAAREALKIAQEAEELQASESLNLPEIEPRPIVTPVPDRQPRQVVQVSTAPKLNFDLQLTKRLSYASRIVLAEKRRQVETAPPLVAETQPAVPEQDLIPEDSVVVKPPVAEEPSSATLPSAIDSELNLPENVSEPGSIPWFLWAVLGIAGAILFLMYRNPRRTMMIRTVPPSSPSSYADWDKAKRETKTAKDLDVVDFDVRDLTAKTTPEKGDTIELDFESTRQLEESYLSEFSDTYKKQQQS